MRFSILGCKVRIDFLFVLVLCLSALFSAYDLVYVLLFSALHELGHLVALLLVGGKADEIILSYYGAALKYSTELSRTRELIVLSAGPLVNLILYLILRDDYNLVLLVINMLPLYPLDAGRILDLYLFRLPRRIMASVIFFLFVFSVYLLIKYNSFSMLIIVVYLTIYSIKY